MVIALPLSAKDNLLLQPAVEDGGSRFCFSAPQPGPRSSTDNGLPKGLGRPLLRVLAFLGVFSAPDRLSGSAGAGVAEIELKSKSKWSCSYSARLTEASGNSQRGLLRR